MLTRAIVLTPLPILAFTIYYVNTLIHRKSEHIQALLSKLTTNAQESYSGIRVIKSFVQEKAIQCSAISTKIARNTVRARSTSLEVEAIYFPSMGLMIGEALAYHYDRRA